ncbi:MAG: oxidoreductase [Pseudolysinimonas sp.]|uniref:FAD-dependent oxidoreductase n=1 Tax=Pseudolysinimonas sp. TaxID=2680009 RepID=UPI003265153E
MIARLDTLLGKMTMYRQVVYTLAVLQLLAVLFSALGLIGTGGPLEMVVSFAVLFVATTLINRLFAAIFRMRAHNLSTLITAQILFFLLAPPHLDQPLRLVALAVAGAIAVASKYLLAIRGRHLVNPAAFGTLVIVALSAVVPAWRTTTWWIATDWMLPFVVVGGILILFRTRRLPMGGVFVAAATVAGLAYYVILGAPLLDSVRFVLVTSPILFLGGFMLSEPLTLPPRRWQQLGYAVVVGVLMWGTSWIPVVGNHPEFALLVANVLAFLVGQRRGIRLVFAGKRQLSPTSWEFDFTPEKPVTFRPGQFMELTLPHAGSDSRGWRRVFSIASAPGGQVRFGIRLPEKSSSFKRALLDLAPGSQVSATAVGGDFLLPAVPKTPLLLVAGGIGITPFIGSLEQAAVEKGLRDIVVVYAISSTDDLAYVDRLTGAGCRVILASPEKPAELPAGWTWIGPGRVTGESLLAAVPDAVKREAFLSGPPTMVADLRRALRQSGVHRVHTDVFVGY